MHRLATELVIGSLVLLEVRTSETLLVAWPSVDASGTCVPIFNVETTRETHILVGELFGDVGVAGVLDASLSGTRWDIWDHCIGQRERCRCSRTDGTAAMISSTRAIATAAACESRRCPLLGGAKVLAYSLVGS